MIKKLVVVMLFGLVFLLGANAIYERVVCSPARSELLAIFDEINEGWTPDTVVKRSKKKPNLFVYRDANQIRITEPMKFGAANWVLIVSTSDSRIEALRIRLMDSDSEKPAAAPADKWIETNAVK